MPAMLESFHQRRDEVVAAVRSLSAIAAGVGAKTLAARVDADLVKKLEADRFHLVVVGEFNHGKSTFVNALLGAQVLPVGVTPTTAVIHHLEYADSPRAEVVQASGARTPLPFDEVRKFAVGGESAPHDAASDEVKHLEVGYPAEILRERIVLVDTPGVNDLSLQRADITYSYIPRSDAVLFLLDAGQPLKESERVFLQEKLLKASRDKILFVVTKRDIWDDAEQREALGYIEKELGKIVKNPKLFAVSAEKHLEGDVMSSGIGELLAHLTKFLAEERGRILLDNALGEGVEAGKLLRRGIDARRRAAAMTVEELERRIGVLEKDLAGTSRTIEERRAGIREEVSAIKAWVRRDLEHFRDDVIKQLPAVIEQASIDELKGYLGRFLERTLTEWAQAETKEIGLALEALAEKTIALMREDANDTAKRLGDALGGDVRAPNVEVDTFKYDVGVVGLLTVGAGVLFTNPLIGGLLLVAAPVLAVVVRGRVEAETKKRAIELAPNAIRDAAAKIQPKLDQMIDECAARLDAWVVTAGEELHKEVIEVLTTAKRDRSAQQQTTESALAACDAAAAELDAATARIDALRLSLRAPDGAAAPTPLPAAAPPPSP
jgi:ribosome biogenesis GTPase A